ncbi:MAG: hypothetical protein R3F37_15615 [Candidatus Competibacteraceae bacterium]
MDFEPGEPGVLDEALKLVDFELPGSFSDEEKSRLAVEIYKAWLLADASARISNAINQLALSLEALGLDRNNS